MGFDEISSGVHLKQPTAFTTNLPTKNQTNIEINTEYKIPWKHNDNELAKCVIRPSFHTSNNPLNTWEGVGKRWVVPIEDDKNQNENNNTIQTDTIIVLVELVSVLNGVNIFFNIL